MQPISRRSKRVICEIVIKVSAARVPPPNEMKVSRFRSTAFGRQKDREWKDWSLTAVCSNGMTSKPGVDTHDEKCNFSFLFGLAAIDSRRSLSLPPSCQASQNEIYLAIYRLSRWIEEKSNHRRLKYRFPEFLPLFTLFSSSIISLLVPRSCYYHPLRFLLFLLPTHLSSVKIA